MHVTCAQEAVHTNENEEPWLTIFSQLEVASDKTTDLSAAGASDDQPAVGKPVLWCAIKIR